MLFFKAFRCLHDLVEIAGRLIGLEPAAFRVVPREFTLGVFLCKLMRNAPRMRQDVALIELQEGVQLAHPVGHMHGPAAAGLVFSIVEVHCDDAV